MDDIELANQAELLTKNAAFQKALSGFKDALVKKLEVVPLADHAIQHEIVISLQVLSGIERQLRTFIIAGDIERNQAKAKEDWEKRKREQEVY